MKRINSLILADFLILTASAQLPVKYDDQYKTIFAKDLCKLASGNQEFVLIDVRSPGEFSDTSQYNYLNIGHLKSAINIPIDSIQKDIAVLNPYKDKTMVFYCSHSQRSRRVSYLLSQKGFSEIYNLNGGMSHLNQMTAEEFPCKQEWLQSNLKYRNISSVEAVTLVQDPKVVVLDVRPSSMYHSRDSLPQHNVGRLRNAINMPFSELKQRSGEIKKFKDSPLLVYANTGNNDAGRSAIALVNEGFRDVSVLVGGMDDLLARGDSRSLFEHSTPYKILNATGTLNLLKENKDLTVYDTRSKTEFENKMPSQEYYRNLGNIKGAIHIAEKDYSSLTYPKNKKAPILIYGREEAYELAQYLSNAGYTNVYILRNFYDFIASAFNIAGNRDALLYLENHEGLY